MCKHAGMLNENCPYAEIWVTSNNKDDQAVQAAAAAGGEVAAAATPKTKTTTDFVLTNGERPYVLTSSGAKYYQPVLEIVGAKIEFVGQPLCWYLDSSFCAVRPHALATSPVRYALTHPTRPNVHHDASVGCAETRNSFATHEEHLRSLHPSRHRHRRACQSSHGLASGPLSPPLRLASSSSSLMCTTMCSRSGLTARNENSRRSGSSSALAPCSVTPMSNTSDLKKLWQLRNPLVAADQGSLQSHHTY